MKDLCLFIVVYNNSNYSLYVEVELKNYSCFSFTLKIRYRKIIKTQNSIQSEY